MLLIWLWRPVLYCGNRWWKNQSPLSNWEMFRIHRDGGWALCSRLNISHTEIEKRKEVRLAPWRTQSQSLLLTPYFHFLLPFQPFIITFHSSSFIKLNNVPCTTGKRKQQTITADFQKPSSFLSLQHNADKKRHTCYIAEDGDFLGWKKPKPDDFELNGKS